MTGIIVDVTDHGVIVEIPETYPGKRIPAQAIVHRVVVDAEDLYTLYREGDVVHVYEDAPNEFTVDGLIQGG